MDKFVGAYTFECFMCIMRRFSLKRSVQKQRDQINIFNKVLVILFYINYLADNNVEKISGEKNTRSVAREHFYVVKSGYHTNRSECMTIIHFIPHELRFTENSNFKWRLYEIKNEILDAHFR